MVFAGLIALVAGGDLWLKQKIEKQKPEGFPRPLAGTKDRIWLYRNHNAGFPFGFMEKQEKVVQTLPLILTSMLIGGLLAMGKDKGRGLQKLAMSMVIGGSLSNLYDRYIRGYVVDYFSLRFGPLKEVVFNLGDIFILLGAGLQAVCISLGEGKRRDGE
ncbi:MAG: signal peptidase II [Lachnospiraceae bacterium]|jgi:signal peptidase II|nr:signal peptidase II [Lachnospiraceae bacterium]MCI9283620.1 signal peptidase II [Lachnospiraceae bacterium]